jgi:glucuronate isomerase
VLFPLNLSDQPALAVLQGSFSQDNVPSKVQLGPAWWWCDHIHGMEESFENIAAFGVLSQFIGMTTDSRSLLSFLRHDYFRQVLCQWISEQNWGLPENELIVLIKDICYFNAKRRIDRV